MLQVFFQFLICPLTLLMAFCLATLILKKYVVKFIVLLQSLRRSGMNGELGVGRCKLFHLERVDNRVLLHSTGTTSDLLG